MIERSAKLRPAGRLVPIFSVNQHIRPNRFTLDLVDSIVTAGETVLLVDCQGGSLMAEAGVKCQHKLVDVIYLQSSLKEAKYITPHNQFTAIDAGQTSLETILGSLAALSLQYDWVIVGTQPGCTPSHIRLAGAADISLLAYDTHSDHFMRAYWMIEACRRRYPLFDPLLLSLGEQADADETADMLTKTISEFLGAPPPYIGHASDPGLIGDVHRTILNSVRSLHAA